MKRFLILLALIIIPFTTHADLQIGSSDPSVKELQSFLNQKGYSVTNYGAETTFFGPATEAALTEYQLDHAEQILGGEGVLNNLGTLNLLTKRYIQSHQGQVLGATTESFTIDLSFGMTHPDVQRLQVALNGLGILVATDGSGSPGQETTYYGKRTVDAVARFQETHCRSMLTALNLTSGTGYFGPGTRECLNTLLASPVVTAAPEPTAAPITGTVRTLRITLVGNGSVTANGQTCSTSPCALVFANKTQVTLIAIPNTGNSFSSWSGRCSGTNTTCTTTLSRDRDVTATFSQVTPPPPPTPMTYTLTAAVSGQGTIIGTGITCGIDCTETYTEGTSVTLTAIPVTGNTFIGWSGSCAGTASTCTVTMNQARTVSASFAPVATPVNGSCGIANGATLASAPTTNLCTTGTASSVSGSGPWSWSCLGSNGGTTASCSANLANTSPTVYTLTTSVSGSGSISSSPSGITCGSDCTQSYTSGTIVTLTATPQSGYTFSGWGGSCSSTGSCTVTMSQARSVTATFTATAPSAVNGTCGISNGATLASAPTTNLCTTGTASSVTGSGPWYWSCLGSNGGTTASCSAFLAAPNPTVYTLTTSVTGQGTITGTGITCGTDCTQAYTSGTVVTLTATPASGSTFAGWSGACTGTGSCTITMSAARSVTATFTQTTTPPPTGGTTYYFSDCQTGAASGCVAGNNANSGTSMSAPKRDLSGTDVDALPAGTNLLFARGGAWNHHLQVVNPNATAAAPITFADYGSGDLPILRTTSGTGIEFGGWGDTLFDGGYTLRNLVLDGGGTGQWAVWVRGEVHDVIIENVEMRGFAIGVHSSPSGRGVVNLTVRNSFIHDMVEHGQLGGAVNLVLENNRFANNNPTGGGFEHGAYLSAGESAPVGSGRIVGNVFSNNSAPSGVCNGGNLTFHGVWDGMLIEGNRVEQAAATGGCYGMSITAAYSSAESFRNFVFRNNTISNVGYCAFCLSSAPGVIVENNKVYNTQATYQVGVLIPAIQPGAGDVADSGAIIRNNTICYSQPAAGSGVASAPSAGSVTGNIYQTGAAASTGACAL